MANLKINLDHPLKDGETITFKAPCDCTTANGIIVYYPDDTGENTLSKEFAFRDSHMNDITSLGNLFMEGALVSVVVDLTDSAAQLLNADTNGYLENKLGERIDGSITIENQATIRSSVNYYKIGGLCFVEGMVLFLCNDVVDSITLNFNNAPPCADDCVLPIALSSKTLYQETVDSQTSEVGTHEFVVDSYSPNIRIRSLGQVRTFVVGVYGLYFSFRYPIAE